MSFQVQSFITIRICSADVTKSRDWYRNFFSIEPIEDLKNFVSFKINGVCLDISLADEKSPTSQGGSVGYWLVDDLDRAMKRATELGGELYRGPLRVEEVQRTIVQIKDPVGNVIGLEAEFREKVY